jgi:predicted DNA-binding transcriptional regulator AlpA
MHLRSQSFAQPPRVLPDWHTTISDLGSPKPDELARLLGISRRSVYRYEASGRAPRVVLLALFWLTRWGRSEVECDAVNRAQLATATAAALADELKRARRQLATALRLNATGAANDPIEGFHGGD